MPGGGGETVLAGSGDARQPTPQVGTPTPWNTKGGWFFSCLSALKSGQPGEGFLGHAPDGTKYYFDWMVARENESAVLQPYDTITHATLKRKKDSGAFHLSDIGISSQVRDVDWLGGTAGRPLVGGSISTRIQHWTDTIVPTRHSHIGMLKRTRKQIRLITFRIRRGSIG